MNTYYNDYVRVRNFSYITSIYNNQVTVGEKYNEDPIFINWITKEKDAQMIKNTQLYRATQEGINYEKFKISKTLLNKNMNIEDIMDITGLSKEELEKL
mgnify:FL=1